MLSEMQKDGLTEIVNIAVGQGADVLSEMTGQKVELSIPYLEIINNQLQQVSPLTKFAVPNGHIISSSIKFGTEFKGKAFLMFPAKQAKFLVGLCLGEFDYNQTVSERDLLDTDFDVLKEIGNIILNSVVGGLGNFLDCKLTYSLPEIEMLFVSVEDQRILLQGHMHVLVLQTRFCLATTHIEGTILIALSIDSITQLINRIDQLMGNSNESDLY